MAERQDWQLCRAIMEYRRAQEAAAIRESGRIEDDPDAQEMVAMLYRAQCDGLVLLSEEDDVEYARGEIEAG